MRTRAIWMLGLALFLAGAAVFLARSWLETQVSRTQREATAPTIETTPVVVAAAQFQFGSPIRREHLRVVSWPATAVPQGAFATINDIIGDGQDRVALRPMEINEPVLASKVSGFGGRASLSSIIAADMRASTIRVNDVNGVAGFVLPGDRVDIMLTRAAGGAEAGGRAADNLVTDLLLQNVKILGVDQDANENRDKPAVVRTVTLEVTVEQSQKLTLAQQVGTLSLSLRNISNTDAEAAKTVGLRDLGIFEVNTPPLTDKPGTTTKQAQPEPAVTAKPAPKSDQGFQVRIVRGTAATEYAVQQERGGPLLGTSPRLPTAPEALAPRPADPAAGPTAGGPPTLLLRPAPTPAPAP